MNFDSDEDILVIAEIGVNHEGSINYALDLMNLAADAGARIVKFQSYTPGKYISADQSERLERVKKFALSIDEFKILYQEARSLGIEFLSTPLSEDWVEPLNNWCSAFKIASGDIDFKPVIDKVVETGKPMIISTGGSDVDEIDQAVSWASENIPNSILGERVILMHCVSAYPTPIGQANILSIPFLKERYKLKVGYSNHVIGANACLAAVALGADLIEVHFTDNKINRDFHDHNLSFDYNDLKNFISSSNEIRKSLGSFGCYVQECERKSIPLLRKGIVAARNLKKGDTILERDLMYARPATEFKAQDKSILVGKVLSENVDKGFLIKKDYIK